MFIVLKIFQIWERDTQTEGRQKDGEKADRKREVRGKRKGRKYQCKRKAFKQQQDKFCNF